MDCNCLRQVYGERNLHGKKSPKGCRKLFAATLPQSLRQTCRSSSPEDPFFGKGITSLITTCNDNTVKGFNFAVLKVCGFLDGTFRGGFNFADLSINTYI